MNASVSAPQPPLGAVLIMWAGDDPALRSTGHTLAGLLSADPHHLAAVEADLAELVPGRWLVDFLMSRVAGRLSAATLAGRAWDALESQLRLQPPRIVVALDTAAARIAAAWRTRGLIRAPLCGVCCGLRLDPAWADAAPDRLSVADQTQAGQALELGIPPDVLVPCGIPVCGGFGSVAHDDKEPIRRRFGLPLDRPVVLVVSHDMGAEALTGSLLQLSMVADRAALLFDVARDEEGAELLRRRIGLWDISAQMFGKVEEAPLLWGASDLVLARPHLYVEQRALALRLPLVSLQPRSGAEQETAAVWSARGVGRTVEHLSTLAVDLELQLRPVALQAARNSMAEISRRCAAPELARFIAQARAQSEQLLAEAVQRQVGQVPPSPAPPSTPPPSPLEPIGVSRDDQLPPESVADIEAAEAEANRQVTEHQREIERWSRRAALAAEKGVSDLKEVAERAVQREQAAMHRALAELGRLAARRQQLPSESSASIERSRQRTDAAFRELEIDEALAALKRKL